MKNKSIIIFAFLIFQFAHCQTTVKMTSKFGVKDKELQDVLFFENLDVEAITFDSKAINGKNYEINLTEYKNGSASNTVKLFDTSSSQYFKIDSTYITIKFFSKVTKDEVETPHTNVCPRNIMPATLWL